MRKTIEISRIAEKVNAYNRDTIDQLEESRLALNMFVTDLLTSVGSYSGFRYLTQEEVGEGKKPGINPANDFKNTDPTRIKFFI